MDSDDDSGVGTDSFLRLEVTQGQILHIALDGKAGAVGQINFKALINQSLHDDFANARNMGDIVTGLFKEELLGVEYGNRFATLEAGENPVTLFGQAADKTLWYKWTPDVSGVATIDTKQ